MSEEPNTVRLNVTDDCFERARKLLECAGICDGVGFAARMAEGVEGYRKMDLLLGAADHGKPSPPQRYHPLYSNPEAPLAEDPEGDYVEWADVKHMFKEENRGETMEGNQAP